MTDETFGTKHLYTAVQLSLEHFHRESNLKRSGVGTGFILVSAKSGSAYLVTNRHLTDLPYADHKGYGYQLGGIAISGYSQHTRCLDADVVHQTHLVDQPVCAYPADDSVDVCVVSLGEASLLPGFNTMGVHALASGDAFRNGTVHVGSQVLTPGYPSFNKELADRPILVIGTVSSDPRYDAVMGSHVYSNRVLCQSFSRAGMSGSPVMAIAPAATSFWGEQSIQVVGLNTGHVSFDDPTIINGPPSVLTLFTPATEIAAVIHSFEGEGDPISTDDITSPISASPPTSSARETGL
ncbi:serine protease [Rhodococcus sp. ARC_M12]|uniref:trypsin-like peptidase domain-containing protein n=1 Tax=Rhodococcus sp. ARC_M12 TaxID=2928854 RepID=UPI001FB42D0E|nr:trypsin-like peptidase domain-containing protein [Rhodococcus sp. ARC_M12]MCJ0980936.1 serine protease [Rhodococcus sp. ARC_M12]